MTARRLRGMTLIEIMIAIAILGLMMVIAWTTIKSASDARTTYTALEERNHEIRLGLARLVNDLESAYLSKNEDKNLDNKRTIFVGKDDEVRFSSFGHLTLWSDGNESDQTMIAYYLDDDRADPSVDSLYRKELRRPSNENWERQPGELDILIRGVEKLELEYWNWQDKKWQSDWDSSKADGVAGRLPTRVRIKLTYKNSRGDEVSITTQARPLLEEQLQY
ncbi:MAG: prepilin-type N-terminal cleavage/methylation domain-containing protein [Myxococcales bacterium]|nr:prepilin-type N-terminal cleavage/methylation domain-containing protein [Myxococcales bacterium]